MGAANVSAVYTMYAHLPHRAHRLLVYMALVSLDNDSEDRPARRFFGGQDAMVEALNLARDTPTRVRTAQRTVRAVLSELERAGAIERRSHGRNGRRSEYTLRLNPLPGRGVTHRLQEVRDTPPKEVRDVPPKEVRDVPPKENRGTTEEIRPGQPALGAPPHLKPLDSADQNEMYRQRLNALGPEQAQRYLEAALDEGITETAAMVRRAAEIARVAT